jgi:hypothetical protein
VKSCFLGCFLGQAATGEHLFRQILDFGIEDYAVASDRCQVGIGSQFCQHVIMGVIGRVLRVRSSCPLRTDGPVL